MMLTDEQVENWRRTLFGMIGPAALVLPREEIQNFRDSMQARADKMGEVIAESSSTDSPMTETKKADPRANIS